MQQQNIPALQPTLEEVSAQLDNWRKNKKSIREPIPQKLWQQAVELSKKHSVSIISNTLRLSYTDLKERVYGPSVSKPSINKKYPDFIEIKCGQPFLVSEATLEIEDKNGLKMKVCFKGKPDFDLMNLAKAFLEKNL